MAVKMRLARMGRKKKPFYRIVVTDSHGPQKGEYIECVGTYNPLIEFPNIYLKEEKVNYWLDQGVVPTDTVRSILQKQGVILKRHLKKCRFDDSRIEEELKKWEVLQIERQRRKKDLAETKKKEKKAALMKEEEKIKEATLGVEEQVLSGKTETKEEVPVLEGEVTEKERETTDEAQMKDEVVPEKIEVKEEKVKQIVSKNDEVLKEKDSGEKSSDKEETAILQLEKSKDKKAEPRKLKKDRKPIESQKTKKGANIDPTQTKEGEKKKRKEKE